jgi:NAD+ synthase (glutamine-hydrolysing)
MAAAPRIALCQMRVHPGEPRRNAEAVLAVIEAYRGRADLIAFPEMCVPGYLLGDAWERAAFLNDCEGWNQRIVAATADGPAVVFGTVVVDKGARGEDGRPRKYNAWIFAADGRALEHPGLARPYGIKTLLPNYREFEDTRHFYDARRLALETGRDWRDFLEPVTWEFGGTAHRVGVMLCEDAWEDDYVQKPVEALAAKRPDFTFNLSASPFTRGKNDKRNRVFGAKARLLGSPLLYVNAVGIQNNGKTLYTFDGQSTVYGANGAVLREMEAYQEAVEFVEIGKAANGGRLAVEKGPGSLPSTAYRPPSVLPFSIPEAHRAIRYGAETFLESTGLRKVVIGVSGGIDSAVAAALFAEFVKPEDLLLVNMPSRFNSATTRDLAKALAANIGCLYAELPIEESLKVTMGQIGDWEASSADGSIRVPLRLQGVAFENTQARDRGGRLLAALAASFGGVFTCNINKAETTPGFGTLYGDIAGFLSPLGDLWKHEVYALGRHLNEVVYGRAVIPDEVFEIVPSPELSADHAVDEGKGDPMYYPYHDRLFYSWVQRWDRATPEENLAWYLDGSLAKELQLPPEVDLKKLFPRPRDFVADLERWWGLYVGAGVVKRVQAPPVLAVSSRAFGYDHREYLGKAVYTERYQELKKQALGNKNDEI